MLHTDAILLVQWFNLVRCFCFGLSGAYDTLGSQAYGSGNKVITTASILISKYNSVAVVLPLGSVADIDASTVPYAKIAVTANYNN